MPVSQINTILAENLARLLEHHRLSQMAQAQKSGVAQTTISNYLNPGRRGTGKSGKAASAKLTELELLAEALGVEAWTLIQPIKSSPGI